MTIAPFADRACGKFRPDLTSAPTTRNAVNPHELPSDLGARAFEDYRPGLTVECGPVAVSGDEIVAFGRQFDPQPFHVDAAAAARGPYAGVIASGWHTASLMMRLLVDHFLPRGAGLGSPGVDELRWLSPVRPGDALRLRIVVTEARRSRSKPDRGLVRTDNTLINQHDEAVLTVKTMVLMHARSGADATTAAAG
jgi:acyl dehydratase